ncbi:MAG: hypothetical protein MJ092_05965 [Lachnospiraceae bacterium]|nr:hypothetical protein [Lachnospiraceae bacterium]
MIKKSPKSLELYKALLEKGYPEGFAVAITDNLNTDFTAGRMLGYLRHYDHIPMEDVADEMLAILSDRAAIIQKKEMEATQASWNQMRNDGIFKE